MLLKRFPVEYQMDSQDCGPASLKIIAKYFGKFYSLQYLRDRCGITKEGVSLLDLSTGAESIGLRTLATNSLDVINERKIVDALNGAFKDRTVIVVAHRLSTIRNVDQIVVLEKGFIAEIGNHQTLMEKKGHYFNLISTQMA